MEEKICVVCKKSFLPKKGKQKEQITCSKECKIRRGNLLRKYRGRKKFNLEIVSKQCLNCGKEFYVGKDESIDISFCSLKCKNAYHHRVVRPKWSERKKSKWEGNWTEARERDNYICQLCGDKSALRLMVHHLDGTGEKNNKNHNVDNLICLCGSCHSLFHHSLSLVKINGKWEIKGEILNRLGLKAVVIQDNE